MLTHLFFCILNSKHWFLGSSQQDYLLRFIQVKKRICLRTLNLSLWLNLIFIARTKFELGSKAAFWLSLPLCARTREHRTHRSNSSSSRSLEKWAKKYSLVNIYPKFSLQYDWKTVFGYIMTLCFIWDQSSLI